MLFDSRELAIVSVIAPTHTVSMWCLEGSFCGCGIHLGLMNDQQVAIGGSPERIY